MIFYPGFRADVSHAIEVRADGHISFEVHRHNANPAVSGPYHGSCDVFVVGSLILFDVHVMVQDYNGGFDGVPFAESSFGPWVPSQLASIPNIGFLD
ncbi:hypothetical protein EVAR_85632_1 [Eumeta japonica]|uniref:Uncharacterized protein n=1 Tax=Eumeta variegata TaxID=151549 RepID=A0A4C1XRB3_EUMVA|nr:hypothetical protein EVAR_85632_1 [Eumeta japonica]